MKRKKALKVLLAAAVLIFYAGVECEAFLNLKLNRTFRRPAGDPVSFFRQTGKQIKAEQGVFLTVISCRTLDRGRNYEIAFALTAEPETDGSLPKIKGMSLYVFSVLPEGTVQIIYENGNQWTHLLVYEPKAADQIIDEYGGPDSFHTLNYAWLIGASFNELSHDLGMVIIKTPMRNRLKFVVETYVLDEN